MQLGLVLDHKITIISIGNCVRSNTRYVHLVVTPSAAGQLNRRLCPLRSIKGSVETALCMWDLRY